MLAVRGAFVLPGEQAFLEGNFTLRDEAQSWPLLCQVDHSTGQLKVIMLDKVQYEVHVNCLKPNFRKVNQKTDINGTTVKTIIT